MPSNKIKKIKKNERKMVAIHDTRTIQMRVKSIYTWRIVLISYHRG